MVHAAVVASVVNTAQHVIRIGPGVYRIEHDTRSDVVYVAGTPGNQWAFWNGRVYRGQRETSSARRRSHVVSDAAEAVTAPMPGTVLQILVEPGATVAKGDTLLLLEAMKMELPLRAAEPGVVAAIHCHEGQLVQADAVLMELRHI